MNQRLADDISASLGGLRLKVITLSDLCLTDMAERMNTILEQRRERLASQLQSRLDKRGTRIAELEESYGVFMLRWRAYMDRPSLRLAKAIRDEIRPMAREQKIDREILQVLR